jgi:hypothetical protein
MHDEVRVFFFPFLPSKQRNVIGTLFMSFLLNETRRAVPAVVGDLQGLRAF